MQIPRTELTAETFAPFGKVIDLPARQPDASGPGWTWWGENALLQGDERPYGIGYLDLQPAPLQFDWAERHMRSIEMLIPTGGDCLVYAAPAEYPDQPGRLPSLDCFQAFRIRQGQAVLFNPGVWHGAPMAIDQPLNVVVLLHAGTGAQDAYVVRFPQTPVEIVNDEPGKGLFRMQRMGE